MSRLPDMVCIPHGVPACLVCEGKVMGKKCEHGLTTKECYVCASPKYGERKAMTTDKELADAWNKAVRYSGTDGILRVDAKLARQIAARLEQIDKDAERYRWLRPRLNGRAFREAGVIYSEASEIDAAIDAAMKDQP